MRFFGTRQERERDRLIQEASELKTSLEEMNKELIEARKAHRKALDQADQVERDMKVFEHAKSLEEQELQHLIRLQQEKRELEQEQFRVKCTKEKNDAIAKVKDEYRDKIEQQLEARGTELKGMYTEILARLPDVNVMLGNQTNVSNGD